MVLLTACGGKTSVVRVPVETTVIEKVRVPSALLEPCPEPKLAPLLTTGHLERVAQEALEAARCGNADKLAIREWQDQETDQ